MGFVVSIWIWPRIYRSQESLMVWVFRWSVGAQLCCCHPVMAVVIILGLKFSHINLYPLQRFWFKSHLPWLISFWESALSPRPCQEPVALELPEHPPKAIWCLPAVLRGTAGWRTAAQNKWWPLSSAPSIVATSGNWLSYENWHLVASDRGF